MKIVVKKSQQGGAHVSMLDAEETRLPSGLLGVLNGMLTKCMDAGEYSGTLENIEGRWFLSERRELIEKVRP